MEWKFYKEGILESPQNAAIKDFSKQLYESIVRESVQNSLDNPGNISAPVKVKFELSTVNRSIIPGWYNLIDHYVSTKSYWINEYSHLFKDIDSKIDQFGQNIPVLKISDYNTTGMDLENIDIRKTGYYAFTRGNHSHKSSSSSGGSEGQGKATFFAASAIHTFYLHTINKHGSIYEGLTYLASHEYNGNMNHARGYLTEHTIDQPGYEEYENDETHYFRRTQHDGFGTTITVVGFKDLSIEDRKLKLIKSCLRNFWFAINDGLLELEVDDVSITRETVKSQIHHYLPERTESTHAKNNPEEYGTVLSYFETWNALNEVGCQEYEKNLPSLGKCILKLHTHEEYPGKVAFFRKQKMLITKSPRGLIGKGYCGVFICLGEEGNEILRKMEGKTHTEWNPDYCLSDNDKLVAKKAYKEMIDFINESWEDYSKQHLPDSINLKGLNAIVNDRKKVLTKKTVANEFDLPNKKAKHQSEFKKQGFIKKELSSTIDNNDWLYKLKVKSNRQSEVFIIIKPASESPKTKKEENINITFAVCNDMECEKDANVIKALFMVGENNVIFRTNFKVRTAFNITIEPNEK